MIVSMIGHSILFTEENTSSSKSILGYTLTSTAYLAIGSQSLLDYLKVTMLFLGRKQKFYFLMYRRVGGSYKAKNANVFLSKRLSYLLEDQTHLLEATEQQYIQFYQQSLFLHQKVGDVIPLCSHASSVKGQTEQTLFCRWLGRQWT